MFGFRIIRDRDAQRIEQRMRSLNDALDHVGVHPAEEVKYDETEVSFMRVIPATAENALLRLVEERDAYRDMLRDAEGVAEQARADLEEIEGGATARTLLQQRRAIQDALGRIGVDTSIGDKPLVDCIVEAGRELDAERERWSGMVKAAEDSKAIVARNLGWEKMARSLDRQFYSDALREAGREKARLTLDLGRVNAEVNAILALLIERGLSADLFEQVPEGDWIDVLGEVRAALDKLAPVPSIAEVDASREANKAPASLPGAGKPSRPRVVLTEQDALRAIGQAQKDISQRDGSFDAALAVDLVAAHLGVERREVATLGWGYQLLNRLGYKYQGSACTWSGPLVD